VLIVRGEGGKETLATTLRARGASVEYAEVYRRDMPERDLTALCDANGKPVVDVISTSSGDALQHLATMAHAQHAMWLFNLPLVVVHPRHVAAAIAAGFTCPPQVADNASDEAVVAAMIRAREQYHD
jgi:uroporphyrinogen-III synthase